MSQKNLKTYNLLLSGRVQGVGFRYFAEARAARYNIKGYVKNTYDNRVEIICQGEVDNLDKFILEVKNGPSFSHITNVEMQEIKIIEYIGFTPNSRISSFSSYIIAITKMSE